MAGAVRNSGKRGCAMMRGPFQFKAWALSKTRENPIHAFDPMLQPLPISSYQFRPAHSFHLISLISSHCHPSSASVHCNFIHFVHFNAIHYFQISSHISPPPPLKNNKIQFVNFIQCFKSMHSIQFAHPSSSSASISTDPPSPEFEAHAHGYKLRNIGGG